MKKFKFKATKVIDFEVEIDESVWNEEKITKWSETFYDANNIDDIAEMLAILFIDNGGEEGECLEGFGVPMIDQSVPFPYNLTAEGYKKVSTDISINKISEHKITLEKVK